MTVNGIVLPFHFSLACLTLLVLYQGVVIFSDEICTQEPLPKRGMALLWVAGWAEGKRMLTLAGLGRG